PAGRERFAERAAAHRERPTALNVQFAAQRTITTQRAAASLAFAIENPVVGHRRLVWNWERDRAIRRRHWHGYIPRRAWQRRIGHFRGTGQCLGHLRIGRARGQQSQHHDGEEELHAHVFLEIEPTAVPALDRTNTGTHARDLHSYSSAN